MHMRLKFLYFALILCLVSPVVANTANGVLGSGFGKYVPPLWRGVHDANQIAYPNYIDTNNDSAFTGDPLRNYTLDLMFANEVSLNNTRADAERDNNCQFNVLTQNCTDRVDLTNPYRNVLLIENNSNYTQFKGGWKMISLESPAFGNTLNDSRCNYGASWTGCAPLNITAHFMMGISLVNRTYYATGGAIKRFIFGWENEPYGNSFLFPNGTCQERIDHIIDNWPEFYNLSRQHLPSDVKLASPSFTDSTISSCGWNMSIAFFGNFSGTIYEPDFYDFHPYCSSGVTFCFAATINNIMTLADSYGDADKIIFSEMNTNNRDIVRYNVPLATNELLWGQATGINRSVAQQYIYQWSCRGAFIITAGCQEGTAPSYTLFHAIELFNSTPVLRHGFYALNHTKYWYSSYEVSQCYTNDTNVKCFFGQNGSNGFVTMMNFNNATRHTNMTVSGYTLTGATFTHNSSTPVYGPSSIGFNLTNYQTSTALLTFNYTAPVNGTTCSLPQYLVIGNLTITVGNNCEFIAVSSISNLICNSTGCV